MSDDIRQAVGILARVLRLIRQTGGYYDFLLQNMWGDIRLVVRRREDVFDKGSLKCNVVREDFCAGIGEPEMEKIEEYVLNEEIRNGIIKQEETK